MRINQPTKCRTCGARLSEEASLDGLCPRCMIRDWLDISDLEACEQTRGLPRSFGGYELLEVVGQGGMGIVFRARQLNLDRIVAVKQLLAGCYYRETDLHRFHLEAAAAASLHHRCIVAIHDFGEVDGQPFYAMELIEGRNLADVCGGRPLAPKRSAELVKALAEAVQHAHEHGVLHRDLKPSNIIVDGSDQPHITDFGLAKLLASDCDTTLAGHVMGSPAYMAPEQAAGRTEEIGVVTDIYGLGALCYHLLTGRAPFLAATTAETLRQVLDAEPPPPRVLNPAVPRDLETICLKCLERNPLRRYRSAGEVAEDADRFLAQRPVRARRPGPVYRAAKFARRHWIGVGAVAGIVVALALGLGAALAGYRQAVNQRQKTDEARARSQEMVNFIMTDLRPQLQSIGRRTALVQSAQTAVRYFQQLPPELRDDVTVRAHAVALDLLADAYGADTYRWTNQNVDACRDASRKAVEVWKEVVAAHPEDADAAAALCVDEFRIGYWWTVGRTGAERGAFLRDMTHRLRSLSNRFPENAAVQTALMHVLHRWLDYGGPMDLDPEERVAIAFEAHERLAPVLTIVPDSADLQKEWVKALIQLGTQKRAAGDPAGGKVHLDEAMRVALRLIERDPTNVHYLGVGAMAAKLCIGWKEARKYYSTLMSMSPGDPEWRVNMAEASRMDAFEYLAEGRLPEARASAEDALVLARALHSSSFGTGTYVACLSTTALVARMSGDTIEAMTCLQEIRNALPDWMHQPDVWMDSLHLRRFFALNCESDITEGLEDWPAMEQVARAMLEEAERTVPLAFERAATAAPYRAAAQAALGRALFPQDRMEEAVPLLEEAVECFKQMERTHYKFPAFGEWQRLHSADILAAGWLQLGEPSRAIDTLEWALERRKGQLGPNCALGSMMETARTAWSLAEILDPKDPARKRHWQEVVSLVLDLLDDPRVAPGLGPEDRAWRTEVAAALAAMTEEERMPPAPVPST